MKIEKIPTPQSQSYQLLLTGYDKLITATGYKQKGKMYHKAVAEFLSYLETKSIWKIRHVKKMDMVNYYEYLNSRPNKKKEGVLSASSIRNHIFSIELFFNHLLEEGVLTRTISLPRPKSTTEMERIPLSLEEIQLLYNVCETKRDKAILSLAYGCGARRSEIENLQVADVQLYIGLLIIRNGKNDKRREIPLPNAIISYLKDYLINERHLYFKEKNEIRSESFLINNQGLKMSGNNINERLNYLVEKTNNAELIAKKPSLHSLRHSIATHLLDNDANIEFVRKFLGHSEIDTVHIYSKRRKLKQQLTHRIKQQFSYENIRTVPV